MYRYSMLEYADTKVHAHEYRTKRNGWIDEINSTFVIDHIEYVYLYKMDTYWYVIVSNLGLMLYIRDIMLFIMRSL